MKPEDMVYITEEEKRLKIDATDRITEIDNLHKTYAVLFEQMNEINQKIKQIQRLMQEKLTEVIFTLDMTEIDNKLEKLDVQVLGLMAAHIDGVKILIQKKMTEKV
jgi:hypothetical protein